MLFIHFPIFLFFEHIYYFFSLYFSSSIFSYEEPKKRNFQRKHSTRQLDASGEAPTKRPNSKASSFATTAYPPFRMMSTHTHKYTTFPLFSRFSTVLGSYWGKKKEPHFCDSLRRQPDLNR